MTTKVLTVGLVGVLVCGQSRFPARVISTDAKGARPVVVLYESNSGVHEFSIQVKLDGTTATKTMYFEPEPVRTYKYMNLWDFGGGSMHMSLERAQKAAPNTRKTATLKLTYEDGKFVGVEVEEFLNKE